MCLFREITWKMISLICFNEKQISAYLKEGGLTSLADRINTILVQASGRRNWGVVVDLFSTVNCPVVVAVVMNVAVSVVHQAVGTCLLGKGTLNAKLIRTK